MELQLQFILIIASIATFVYIIFKIRKHRLNIDDCIIWMLWSILLLVFSVFPGIPNYLRTILGFQSTSNFILTMFVFFLYLILFFQNIKLSALKEKNKELVQKLSIQSYEEHRKE